jgi:CHASE3 domain sensor protein
MGIRRKIGLALGLGGLFVVVVSLFFYATNITILISGIVLTWIGLILIGVEKRRMY